MKNSTRNEHGFTLIEVMLALAVLSLGILGMMSMQGASIRGNASANTISTASVMAGDKIEEIMSTHYDKLESGNIASGTYQIVWNVVTDEPIIDNKAVQVTVTRLERGVNKTVTYNFVKAKDV